MITQTDRYMSQWNGLLKLKAIKEMIEIEIRKKLIVRLTRLMVNNSTPGVF